MRDLIKHDALLWLVVFQQLWLVHFDPCCSLSDLLPRRSAVARLSCCCVFWSCTSAWLPRETNDKLRFYFYLMVYSSHLIIIILIVLQMINNCYYCREERFILRETWSGYVAVNGESPFLSKLRNDWFFLQKVTRTVTLSPPLKKLSRRRLKTRLRLETWLWLANHHFGPQVSLFQEVI